MKKLLFKRLAVIAAATTGVSAFAIGPDMTQLTQIVEFTSTVIPAVLAVAGSIALLYMAIRGAKTVLGMIRGR